MCQCEEMRLEQNSTPFARLFRGASWLFLLIVEVRQFNHRVQNDAAVFQVFLLFLKLLDSVIQTTGIAEGGSEQVNDENTDQSKPKKFDNQSRHKATGDFLRDHPISALIRNFLIIPEERGIPHL